MTSKTEDVILAANPDPYVWSTESEIKIEDFTTKYKPSMVQNDGTKPWIWVVRENTIAEEDQVGAMEKAAAFLKEVTIKLEDIENDPSIPIWVSKETGAKSKKELREQLQAEAVAKLKGISVEYGFVSGKWLVFAGPDTVDSVWSTLAKSVVFGPLVETSVHAAKVSTSPMIDTPNYKHVICLYMPNVYDKEAVTKVMRVLLRNHGVALSGVKSNLYTVIGLDGKHPSGIPPTIWKDTAILSDVEQKDLRNAYFAELKDHKENDMLQDSLYDSCPCSS